MRILDCSRSLAPAAAAIFLSGCKLLSPHTTQIMHGESLVLAEQEPGHLAFIPLSPSKVNLRSTYRENLTNTFHYVLNQDYVLDAIGQIRRTAGSRIPDFKTNVLYGQEDFNHGKFPGYGNGRFFVYADYAYKMAVEDRDRARDEKTDSEKLLPKTFAKLRGGEKLRIVAFGDSITAGGEASEPGLIYWERWAEALRREYPRAKIEAINGATGGDTTVQGLQRLEEKVLSQRPDLVLIAFGMNDHNREGFGVPLDAFRANLKNIIEQIRARTSAEIILLSTFPPNPKWHFGSHNMAAYAGATGQTRRETGCAYVDVYRLWLRFAAHKKPEDLLANNINHPNDFGHWIYFAALQQMSGSR